MRRRDFVTLLGIAAAWPSVALAQNSDMPVIGFLSARSANESAYLVDAFRKGLSEYGLFEGQNVTVEFGWADSRYDRLAGEAATLLSRKPAVLVAVGGDMTAKAATSVTRTTPIVAIFIGDPVAAGFVASLGRPGGNVTGVSNLNAVIEAKRLGLLREIKPELATVSVLLNPDSSTFESQQKDIEQAAQTVGLHVQFLMASNDLELEAAFKPIIQSQPPALLVPADAFFAASRDKLADLATRNNVPSIHSLRESAVSGALMSYGNDLPDTYRIVGTYAARIIKGASPADLPVIQPTKFQFVINLKTAKVLGLSIPPNMLAIADEVIE